MKGNLIAESDIFPSGRAARQPAREVDSVPRCEAVKEGFASDQSDQGEDGQRVEGDEEASAVGEVIVRRRRIHLNPTNN